MDKPCPQASNMTDEIKHNEVRTPKCELNSATAADNNLNPSDDQASDKLISKNKSLVSEESKNNRRKEERGFKSFYICKKASCPTYSPNSNNRALVSKNKKVSAPASITSPLNEFADEELNESHISRQRKIAKHNLTSNDISQQQVECESDSYSNNNLNTKLSEFENIIPIENRNLLSSNTPENVPILTDSSDEYLPKMLNELQIFKELENVLHSVKPIKRPLNGYEPGNQPKGVCLDLVYPGIYVGDKRAAMDIKVLKKIGITHVLNTAEGGSWLSVNTSGEFYSPHGIQYLGLQLLDQPSANISQHFEECAAFIEECLKGGGRVLVHCFAGISRSATITIAFLTLRRGLSVVEALGELRWRRHVYPNDGFLQQLARLQVKINNS